MKLSVITVTFNNEESISDYLSSLNKALPQEAEVIIVDNNSSDKTVDNIQSFSKVILIQNNQNLGFAKGCNIGAKKARGEYLFFLNPDTLILDDAVNKLLNYMENHSGIGIVAPKIYHSDRRIVQESVRKLPTLWGAIKEYIFNQKNSFTQYVPKTTGPASVESVYGAAMLIKRDVFKKLNGFDEKYFLYYEDLDLCKRVDRLGLKIIYYPGAEIQHQVGKSTVGGGKLPFGIRTLSWFIPVKNTGTIYHQIKSAAVYHGYLTAFIIRLITFCRTRVISRILR